MRAYSGNSANPGLFRVNWYLKAPADPRAQIYTATDMFTLLYGVLNGSKGIMFQNKNGADAEMPEGSLTAK